MPRYTTQSFHPIRAEIIIANQASIAGVLTTEQVSQAQSQSQAITTAAHTGAITSNQFVYLAAFDGANNDKSRLDIGGNPLSTNVAQLSDQFVESTNAQVGYFSGDRALFGMTYASRCRYHSSGFHSTAF